MKTLRSTTTLAIAIAVVHLSLTFASAFVGHGWDLDQLATNPAMKAALAVEQVLMFAHNAVVRALMGSELLSNTPFVVSLVFLNSLAWGVVLALAWRATLAA